MPRHDIAMTVPDLEVRNKDVEIAVRSDDELLGTLKVSRGSIDWFPAKAQRGYRLEWERFDRLMTDHASRLPAPS